MRWTTALDSPDGRIGSDPLQATPEKGAKLIASAAAALLQEFAEFSREPFGLEKPPGGPA